MIFDAVYTYDHNMKQVVMELFADSVTSDNSDGDVLQLIMTQNDRCLSTNNCWE